jgi:hypothetical protein
MRKLLGSLLFPAFLVIYILFFLGTVDGRLEGDDHFALAHASALLAGDRLNVDFFDPGAPLQVVISYVGQLVSGSRPLAEVLIALAVRLIGLTAVYLVTRRLVHSTIAAVLVAATVALFLLNQAIYGAEKVALYPIAVLAAWRYLGGRLSPYVLSVIIAVATLLRHDHGVYVALSMALAVCLGPRPLHALLKVAAGVLVLLSPWLLWVHATEGIVPYMTSRVAFAQDNGLGSARPFGFTPPYLWSENAARWLWHVAAFTSVAALITSIRRRSIPTIVLAGMSVVAAVGLMRKVGQTGEVAALWVPLFVWLIREAPRVGKAALACVGVVSIAAVVTVTRATEELPQIAREGGGLLRRAQSAVQFHMTTPAIDAYAPPDETSDGRLVIRYLHECLRPSDRVWETAMWFPVAYYAQRRPVWHYHWDHGLKHDEAAQHQFLTWITQQQAPVIITHSSGDLLEPFRSYPFIRRYVMTNYREMTSTRFEEYRAMGNKLRLLADIRRVPSVRLEPLALLCFSE